MSKAYSLDLRSRVLAVALEDRTSWPALAARFLVPESTIRSWVRVAKAEGRLGPKPHAGGVPPKVAGAGAQVLRDLVAERSERTLAELATGYRERTGVALGIMAVWRACKRLDLRRKKKESLSRRAGPRGRGRRARGVA